jgi:hypothetical protein
MIRIPSYKESLHEISDFHDSWQNEGVLGRVFVWHYATSRKVTGLILD